MSAPDDDDEFEFERQMQDQGRGSTKGGRVENQHFDEAVDVSDGDESHSQSLEASSDASPIHKRSHQPPTQSDLKTGGKIMASSLDTPTKPSARSDDMSSSVDEHEHDQDQDDDHDHDGGLGQIGQSTSKPSQAKLYNPADYAYLQVSKEIQDLFDYIGRYKPQDVELETKLKPFIPDYIPTVGEIDPFLKVPRPDGKEDLLGLVELDEPSIHQSDPTVLELQLNIVNKSAAAKPVTVRSIEHADKHPKKLTTWIQNITEVHKKKPAPTVVYSKPMPDIEQLMQVWPPEFEHALKSLTLPSSKLDLDINQYSRLVCSMLDIPVHDRVIDSLHVLFTLYSEFRSNAHFQH